MSWKFFWFLYLKQLLLPWKSLQTFQNMILYNFFVIKLILIYNMERKNFFWTEKNGSYYTNYHLNAHVNEFILYTEILIKENY